MNIKCKLHTNYAYESFRILHKGAFIELSNAYFVPTQEKNLLSSTQLISNGATISFSKDRYHISYHENSLLFNEERLLRALLWSGKPIKNMVHRRIRIGDNTKR